MVDASELFLLCTLCVSQVLAVLRDKKPVAYFNGHDHVLAWATDGGAADKTQYITTGAGGDVNVNDGCCQPSASTDNTANEGFNYCGQAFVSSTNAAGKTTKRGRPNVKYTNMNNTLCDAAMKNVDTTVGPNGFVHVEMTATELKVRHKGMSAAVLLCLVRLPQVCGL
jgi:hypothetical protein